MGMTSIKLLLEKSKITDYSYSNDSELFTFVNLYSYLFFRKNIHLFSNFQRIYIDGITLVYLLRLLGVKVERASFDMTSLAPVVYENCIKNRKSIYFVGSKESAINKFIKIVSKSFPRMNILGHRNGYFNNNQEEQDFINHLVYLKPDVVVVGMGTPFQERFLIQLRKSGWTGRGYTCGGYIHQTVNGISYYPDFYDKYNLRWLYRMIDEPKLIKRYCLLYPMALILFFVDVINYGVQRLQCKRI